MRCRYCGTEGAYDSGFTVECPNEDCDHFSQKQLDQQSRVEHSSEVDDECDEDAYGFLRWYTSKAWSGDSD